MSRYALSARAKQDLEDVLSYLGSLPEQPARQIGSSVQQTLKFIGLTPYLGARNIPLTDLFGVEIRSRLAGSYRILYQLGGSIPEVLGILHTARDIDSIMRTRLQ